MKLFKLTNFCTIILFFLDLSQTFILAEDVFNGDDIFDDLYTECGKNKEDTGFIFDPLDNAGRNRPGKWPWVVSIGQKSGVNAWEHRCGGSLVTREHIVTAAHCLVALRGEIKLGEVYIRAGDSHLKNTTDDAGVQIARALNFARHPEYNGRNRYWDVGILKLEHPVELTEVVRTICLPPQHTVRQEEDDLLLVVTGWGEDNLAQSGKALYDAHVQVYPEVYCNRTHLGDRKAVPKGFTSDLFCGGDVAGAKGVCHGDSGSPAVFFESPNSKFILKGVVSGGLSCGTKLHPNIYIRMTNEKILHWVNLKISSSNIISKIPRTNAETSSTSTTITKTPSSCNIAIFSRSYNRGDHQTITEDQENLGSWDNKVVSLKVNGECCWRIFTEVNYGGNAKDFCERAYNKATDLGFLFKDASSLKLIL